LSKALKSSDVDLDDTVDKAELPDTDESLEEVRDQPWRHRVVARSLGAATRQSLARAQAAIRATVALLEAGKPVTVQDVADNAGFSLRVLYRHFSSKEDLLGAVLEDQLEKAAKSIRAELAGIEDPVERIAEFLRRTINIEATPLNLALARQETALVLTHPAEVNRAQAPLVALGCELVEQAVAAGRIQDDIGQHGAYAMLAVRRAYNHASLIGDDFGLPLPEPEQLIDQCLRSLGATRSQ
jgi:AcrR family transcriptional regulator